MLKDLVVSIDSVFCQSTQLFWGADST